MTGQEFLAFKLLQEREHFLLRSLRSIANTPDDSALNLRLVARLAVERDYHALLQDHIARGLAARDI